MAHPHIDSVGTSDEDPSYNPRLRGDEIPIDDTEAVETNTPEIETVIENDRPLTMVERMRLIEEVYGFVPLSRAEVSSVYSIGKRQQVGTPIGEAARRLLQDVHRHQMYTSIDNTSRTVRALTHGFQDNLESAKRQHQGTHEFEEILFDEATASGIQGTVGDVLYGGQVTQHMAGPRLGIGYVEGFIKQLNIMNASDNSAADEPLPEDVMKLTMQQARLVLDRMKQHNVARGQFWSAVCEGAALHKMAHKGLKETIIVDPQP